VKITGLLRPGRSLSCTPLRASPRRRRR
jgi:hypothetical protein